MLQALLSGMHDKDIRTQNDELKGLAAIVDYIAAEEASTASFSSMSTVHTLAGTKSAYKQQTSQRSNVNEAPMNRCTHCGNKHEGNNSPGSRKQFCKAYDKKCSKCSKLHHFVNMCKSTSQVAAAVVEDSVTGGLLSSAEFYAMQVAVPTKFEQLRPLIAALQQYGPVTSVPLPHLVHSQSTGWRTQPAMPSPTVGLDIALDKKAYSNLHLPVPRTSLKPTKANNVSSCADTGAQLTTIPTSILPVLGVRPSDLLPIATNLNTVTGAPVDLIGGILLEFSGYHPISGVKRMSQQLAYVSTTIPYPFLSREACLDLGLIPNDFPSVGSCNADSTLAASTCSNSGVAGLDDTPCSCPVRQLPPSDTPILPCEPTDENLPILRQYIVDRYSASAFNTCEQQPLPLLKDSPPLRLFMDPNATPVAVHSPAAVP